jgi:DNA-binding protein HU-beta
MKGSVVNKVDLIHSVATSTGLKNTDSERAVNAVLEAITKTLKSGDEVRLLGFGTFGVTKRPAGEGRNPRTGEKIKVAAKSIPKFRPGKQLKDAVGL